MARVMLLLGGNVGRVAESIDRAVELIGREIGEVELRSSMMVSEAWGFEQATDSFTNQAVIVSTSDEPEQILDKVLAIEQAVGRRRAEEEGEKRCSGERYASRVIDIDMILYDEVIWESERLTLPHPLMQEREFVLSPICEIAPEWRNAKLGRSCGELYEELMK